MTHPDTQMKASEEIQDTRLAADSGEGGEQGTTVDEGLKPICGYYKKDRCRLGQMCRFAHSLQEHSNSRLISLRRSMARSARKKKGSSSTASIASSCDSVISIASSLTDICHRPARGAAAMMGRSPPSVPVDEFTPSPFAESFEASSLACPGYYNGNGYYSSGPSAAGSYHIPSFSMGTYGLYIPQRRAEYDLCQLNALQIIITGVLLSTFLTLQLLKNSEHARPIITKTSARVCYHLFEFKCVLWCTADRGLFISSEPGR
ncbi:hypothetical protein FOL47_010840 [Perkinsus chesapeaki]|uniref:C3H1-type domain-containing protein n=1 Tax=Perkinsus chesapeaki TaxID=330153 RepID=A0A7J6MNQ4_PERCH|nr:hypothetical protein FOL47_010840 [Perkinsus chesapeaki]